MSARLTHTRKSRDHRHPWVHRLLTTLLLLGAAGCADEAVEVEPCTAISANPTFTLGTWTDDVFTAYEPGVELSLVLAPQGGLGVEVEAQSVGLGEGPFTLTLDTEVDGENTGSHENPAGPAFCQDDGTGLFTPQIVGFFAILYKTEADIASLRDHTVELVVTATDDDGNTAEGRLRVLVSTEE